MLEPRKTDVPALFLFLVVLPVVVYILLGKWGEASNRRKHNNRINFVRGSEVMVADTATHTATDIATATASVLPPLSTPAASFRECARCLGPATTRCSRCKSVRYCSGKCQIIHWRQGHKDDCQLPNNMTSPLMSPSIEETSMKREIFHNEPYPQFTGLPLEEPVQERVQRGTQSTLINAGASSVAASATKSISRFSKSERRASGKKVSHRSTKEVLESNDKDATIPTDGNVRNTSNLSKDTYGRHKLRGGCSVNSKDGLSEKHGSNGAVMSDDLNGWKTTSQQNCGIKVQSNDSLCSKSYMNPDKIGIDSCTTGMNDLTNGRNFNEILRGKSPVELISSNGSMGCNVTKDGEFVRPAKPSKPMPSTAREQTNMAKTRKGHGSGGPADRDLARKGNVTTMLGSNGTTSIGLMKATGLKKGTKITQQITSEMGTDNHKKIKVLFPYEVFTEFFQHEIFDFAPRGLLNCGNSCYANAVLQCLTCTKPLVIYLLSRMHSKTCCLKNWCLICELEQHVMMLKEAGGPLSPSRILSYVRKINCQIGDGSQEDAHEFLRFLVTSMQAVCLEEAGGENQVHPSLQETTFVQQTFGGRLRSMVKCLRCHQESERYENIMDLTLEIFGWVESLEDALTQFTTPEDLDGENMYRCGRCACYVRARKQLSIDEVPNILTVVLKRFQEGNYGKINKCISFPEMLDMIPFMMDATDVPPLYMLYGVVVHVDTLNASFSGHYISYVKDLQGNWFRIDDSVVQPVHVSQVMSEGAYILFYMRSYPRPPRAYVRKTGRQQTSKPSRQSVTETHNSKIGRSLHSGNNNRFTPVMDTYGAKLNGMEYSDATSSDWSLFTSSDEASFTSESTRDSFSTIDYSDTCNADPFCSKFNNTCTRECPSQRTISCRMFSGGQPITRYVSEQRGYIFDYSEYSANGLNDLQIGSNTRQVSMNMMPFNQSLMSDSSEYQNFVYDGEINPNPNPNPNPNDGGFQWTYGN